MINYFNQTLDGIMNSRRTVAKDNAQKDYRQILSAHPYLADAVKRKKSLELEIARCTALKKPCQQAQDELNQLSKDMSDYITANKIAFAVKYTCPVCKDTGYVNQKPCECLIKEYNALLRENLSLSPMPEFTFKDNEFGKIAVPQASGMNKLYKIMQQVCDKFYTTKLQNFLFCGANGTGKTCLAVAVANELISKNISVLYLSSFELVNIFLDKHTYKQTALRKLYNYVNECEMLIIDNLGVEPVYKNVTVEYLLSTIEKRLSEGKKTMLCTQLSGQSLVSRYGETLLSKFADKKYSLSVGYIQGEDMRKL